jgi:acyl-coenzyme A thioesterase PaaI-like protein
MSQTATSAILDTWNRLQGLPGGRALFRFFLGRRVPYTGSISPDVLELEPGRARVAMRDRPRLRNHLRSVHAVALTNLGELATGLAVTSSLPASARGIPTGFSIEFVKKARGTIEASCSTEIEAPEEDRDVDVEAELKDGSGDTVARFKARWRVGPRG